MDTPEIHPDRDLQQQVDDLSATVRSLQQELLQLRAQTVTDAEAPTLETVGSRRSMLKMVGGATAAGALVAVVGSSARPAAAATSSAINAGTFNYASNLTYLTGGTFVNTFVTDPLTTEPTMFWVDNRNSTLNNATGIRGDGKAAGFGVWGNNDFGGFGVYGGSGAGIGLGAGGGKAALQLNGSNPDPNTRSDTHAIGEIDLDSVGNLWLCVAAGTPGIWRQLGGANAAGSFHAITPVRAYDSRWTGDTPIASGTNRTVSVADGHALDGTLNAANAVPAGSTAVAYNLTITNTTTQGFLAVAPGTATTFTTSSINWSSTGQNLANGLIVAIDSTRHVKVFGGGGGATDFTVDITGYFR